MVSPDAVYVSLAKRAKKKSLQEKTVGSIEWCQECDHPYVSMKCILDHHLLPVPPQRKY